MALCYGSGFHGIEIVYPDSLEKISVTLSANSGTVSLSPMMMQFWEPIWSGLSVRRDGEEAKALSLSGHVEVLNMVLQSMQYLGYMDPVALYISYLCLTMNLCGCPFLRMFLNFNHLAIHKVFSFTTMVSRIRLFDLGSQS